MEKNKNLEITTIDEYIAQFTLEVQEKLKNIRKVISTSAPEAKEKISWGMATFVFHGDLVHFACFKEHIGFYPGPNGILAFIDDLAPYKLSKGTIRFPLDAAIPYELIGKIVVFRANENLNRKLENEKTKKN